MHAYGSNSARAFLHFSAFASLGWVGRGGRGGNNVLASTALSVTRLACLKLTRNTLEVTSLTLLLLRS